MSSLHIILKLTGKLPAAWRITLANEVCRHHTLGQYKAEECLYQQGPAAGMQTAIIHACRNLGNPFDQRCHRAAVAVWNEVMKIRRKPAGKAAWQAECQRLAKVYDAADDTL